MLRDDDAPCDVWTPDSRAAAADAAALLRRFCDVLGVQLDADLATQLLHPRFYEWSYAVQGQGAVEQSASETSLASAIAEIRASVRRAETNRDVYGLAIDVPAPFNLARPLAMARLVNPRAEIAAITELTPTEKSSVRNAFALIRAVWPAAFGEIAVVVKCISIFESKVAIGFADIETHGRIGLRRQTLTEDTTQLAEEILHESAHVRLNAIHALRPLFTNDDHELYTTPLRREPRSMFGLFHQMCVLMRLRAYYVRVAESGQTRSDRLQSIERALREAAGVVAEHGQLTDIGKPYLACALGLIGAA